MHAATLDDTGQHEEHPYGLMRWVTTTNHKDIGTLYLWFSFLMFLAAGSMAMLIRMELFQPGLQLVQPALFNQLTTMHGLLMIFGAIMPAFVGFANWQVPLMIGAPDMAFPRLNNWSFWLLPAAATLLIASLFVPAGRAWLAAGSGGRAVAALAIAPSEVVRAKAPGAYGIARGNAPPAALHRLR